MSIRIGAWLGIAWTGALGVVRFASTERPVHQAEWWIADLALGATLAAPGITALASRGRRAWLIAAGATSIVVASVSFAALPLVVPGVVYLIAGASGEASPHLGPAVGAIVVGVAIVLAYAVVLVAPHRIVCWQTVVRANGSSVTFRDRAAESASSDGHISQGVEASSGTSSTSGGCTDGASSPAASVGSLALISGALGYVRRSGRGAPS